MDRVFAVDWLQLWVPTHSVLEMLVRGTVMYLALFLILRLTMKRQAGSVGVADILVIVLIADAAQNGFGNEYKSITEGLVLVVTIVFWNFVIDWIGFRFPAVGRLLQPAPVALVRNGRMLRRNLRREYVTVDELKTHLRKAGIEDLETVKLAVLEGDGEISVVSNKKD